MHLIKEASSRIVLATSIGQNKGFSGSQELWNPSETVNKSGQQQNHTGYITSTYWTEKKRGATPSAHITQQTIVIHKGFQLEPLPAR